MVVVVVVVGLLEKAGGYIYPLLCKRRGTAYGYTSICAAILFQLCLFVYHPFKLENDKYLKF